MPLASSNKTGRKKSKLWKAQDVEFYYWTIVNRVGGVCRYFLKGCYFENTELSTNFNRSMMNVQSWKNKGRKIVESGIKTNAC